MATFLIVDDEPTVRTVSEILAKLEGFEVVTAADGEEALAKVEACAPDFLLLDVLMPKLDGWEVCRQIRKSSGIPIIFLTARGALFQHEFGVSIGGDDYLVSPTRPKVLRARMRWVANLRDAMAREWVPPTIEGADIPSRWTVECPFTLGEYGLLRFLASNPEWAFSAADIAAGVWGYIAAGQRELATVQIHIDRLRKKLGDDPALPALVVRKNGGNYQWGLGMDANDYLAQTT